MTTPICMPKMITFAFSINERELSSAGLEHLPYKQGVNGSSPLVPTRKRRSASFFYPSNLQSTGSMPCATSQALALEK